MVRLTAILPLGLAIAAVVAGAFWLGGVAAGTQATRRVAGTDRPPGLVTAEPTVNLTGTLTAGPGEAGKTPGAWPMLRGPAGTGVSAEAVTLQKQLKGIKPLWSVDLGEGYAGPAILDGRVYLLDYNQEKRRDAVRCLSLDDGREIWRREYDVDVKRNHGMSRTVPAVTKKHLVTLGPKCHVVCLDPVTGDFKWGKDLVREYGTKVPQWYAGQCPIIETQNSKLKTQNEEGAAGDEGAGAGGERVILAPAGKSVLMVAVEAETGKEIWETPNPDESAMTHSSILPVDFAGRHMYVYCGSGGIAGVNAADGKILWSSAEWKVSMATVPTPVDMGEGRLFLSGGYGAGSAILQLTNQGGTIEAKIVKRMPPEVFGAEQQTPIFYQGHIYGAIPGGEMVCLDRDGNVKWTSGGANRYGLAPFLIADGSLFALNDTGTLSAIEATPAAFELQSKTVVIEKAHECWGPMALAGGKMVVRELKRMVCVELGKN